jgi:hypothetical protein
MKKLFSICCALIFLFVTGCASTLEDANKGAEEGGKPAGKVLRIPNSFSKGVAEGVAGEPESNPYSR